MQGSCRKGGGDNRLGESNMAENDPIIDIAELDFAYGRQAVLKGIDLPVRAGTALGIIGPNGGGKSTLLRLLLGLLSPTRGRIRIAGLSPRQARRRGDLMGYLPQNPRISRDLPLTARQVVHLGLAGKTGLLHRVEAADRAFADALMRRTGAEEFADQPVAELSGGQLQRVLICRALAAQPKILLLDEPTTGIDAAGQVRFVEFLNDLKQLLNLTLVLVSHDLRTVSAIADRIACLNLTLHYHDIPGHVPAEVIHRTFACDLEAMQPWLTQSAGRPSTEAPG